MFVQRVQLLDGGALRRDQARNADRRGRLLGNEHQGFDLTLRVLAGLVVAVEDPYHLVSEDERQGDYGIVSLAQGGLSPGGEARVFGYVGGVDGHPRSESLGGYGAGFGTFARDLLFEVGVEGQDVLIAESEGAFDQQLSRLPVRQQHGARLVSHRPGDLLGDEVQRRRQRLCQVERLRDGGEGPKQIPGVRSLAGGAWLDIHSCLRCQEFPVEHAGDEHVAWRVCDHDFRRRLERDFLRGNPARPENWKLALPYLHGISVVRAVKVGYA